MGDMLHKQNQFVRLRQQAEELLRRRDGEGEDAHTDDVLELIHELQVHQAELEIQNEELLVARDEVDELQKKYQDLFDFAPCGYLTLNPQGICTQANTKALELLDTTRGHLHSATLSQFFQHGWETAYAEAKSRSAETGSVQSLELPLKRKGDPPLWVQAEIKADLDREGYILQWRLILVDISARKATEISLVEKETLLKEIHHRVKNNMQVISSLISLQAGELPEGGARSALEDIKHRVKAMAMVHDKLYQSPNLAQVEFDSYIGSLTDYLIHVNQTDALVRLELDLETVRLPVHMALPCGLIVSELFCNAMKHAFKGRARGLVRIGLHKAGPDRVSLSISDDGVGLPEGSNWREANSLGLRLVHMLAGQLGAEVGVASGEGTTFTLTFSTGE